MKKCGLGLALAVGFLALSANAGNATPVTWVNETDLATEADFAILQSPATMSVTAGMLTPNVFGMVFEAGKTESAGGNATVLADLGYGTLGTDPRTDASWIWIAASFANQVGNNDVYSGQFLAPLINGTYEYTFRFSVDGGSTYTAADLNGAGSNAQQTFDANNLGALTVTGGLDPAAVPEPASLVLLGTGVASLVVRRKARKSSRHARVIPTAGRSDLSCGFLRSSRLSGSSSPSVEPRRC